MRESVSRESVSARESVSENRCQFSYRGIGAGLRRESVSVQLSGYRCRSSGIPNGLRPTGIGWFLIIESLVPGSKASDSGRRRSRTDKGLRTSLVLESLVPVLDFRNSGRRSPWTDKGRRTRDEGPLRVLTSVMPTGVGHRAPMRPPRVCAGPHLDRNPC
jgi:hypothetical protein